MDKRDNRYPTRSGRREIAGILVGMIGLMLLLGILSYNPMDLYWFCNHPEANNWIGPVGAHTAFAAFMTFGMAAYAVPLGFLWIGLSAVFRSDRKLYPKALWFLLALFCLAGLFDLPPEPTDAMTRLNLGSPGGLIGDMLTQRTLGRWIGHVGASIVFVVLLLIAFVRMLEMHPTEFAARIRDALKRLKLAPPDKSHDRPKRTPREPAPELTLESDSPPAPSPKKAAAKKEKKKPLDIKELLAQQQAITGKNATKHQPEEKTDSSADLPNLPLPKKPRKTGKKPTEKKEKNAESLVVAPEANPDDATYRLPSLDLLDPPVKQGKGMSPDEISSTAQILQDALEEFGVEARVVGVQQGPVVTCYEIEPAPGVRVERIKALSDNLALKMRAESIRIQAPIPGKGVCGVEIPNSHRAAVLFRDLVAGSEFQDGKQALPLVLGKDVEGKSMIFDLAKMPHLLIAGATGAGKSVGLNAILMGLLMKHPPADMRLILVDPKGVEFHPYNNLPHLVVPVITEAKKVPLGLKWAIDEMERRFKWFRLVGARDLTTFNARAKQKQEELFAPNEVAENETEEKKPDLPPHLPYIVIVIDELADLMAVAQAEIEAGIARLAAKSRAAGIHMILATQRPDVKVITGTIKANFPARIAFKVSQKVDSRTILDRMGADALLGKRDMLVLPPGSDKLVRSQGAYTSDGEIDRVTEFCKAQGRPEFIVEIKEKIDKPTSELPDVDDGADDDLLEQALEVIRQTKRASTSSLQRRLRIGYTRAARIMDLLEERGFIGPPEGSGPREILIDLDGEIPQNPGTNPRESEDANAD